MRVLTSVVVGALMCVFGSSAVSAEPSASPSETSFSGTTFDRELLESSHSGTGVPEFCGKQALWSQSAGYYRPFWFEILAVLHEFPEIERIAIAIPTVEHGLAARHLERAHYDIRTDARAREAYWPEDMLLLSYQSYHKRVAFGDGTSIVAMIILRTDKGIVTRPIAWCQSLRPAVAWAFAEATRRMSSEVAKRDVKVGMPSLPVAVSVADPAATPKPASPPVRTEVAAATSPPLDKIVPSAAPLTAMAAPVPIPMPLPPGAAESPADSGDDGDDDEEDNTELPALASAPPMQMKRQTARVPAPIAPAHAPTAVATPPRVPVVSAEIERLRCVLARRLVRGKIVHQSNGTITFVVEIPNDLKCTSAR